MDLRKNLEQYDNSEAYPFHMPGHKRNRKSQEFDDFWPPLMKEWFRHDITEIDDFDNLHHAEGILRDSMDLAAQLYGAKRSYFLINGSTCGILVAISAAVPRGGKILMMRNCHKSAYHAVLLRQLQPVYIYSQVNPKLQLDLGITTEVLKEKLDMLWSQSDFDLEKQTANDVMKSVEQNPEIKAVFLTSPTYEGISINIREIAEMLHKKGIALIVDAAHGAHFGMADYLPMNAVEAGADLVIHSLHKTLPSPTQTALLHFNSELIQQERVEQFLAIYETSSPSYPMMAAMDLCIRYMMGDRQSQWKKYYEMRRKLTEEIKSLKYIGVLDYFHQEKELHLNEDQRPEIGKMLLYLKANSKELVSHDGKWLYDRLRLDYKLQPELALPNYVLLITTFMDTQEGYERLAQALKDIDGKLEIELGKVLDGQNNIQQIEVKNNQSFVEQNSMTEIRPKVVMSIADADEQSKEWCELNQSVGQICGAFIYVYPPGQPILVPGEMIDEIVVHKIKEFQKHSFEVHGLWEDKICVCRPKNKILPM